MSETKIIHQDSVEELTSTDPPTPSSDNTFRVFAVEQTEDSRWKIVDAQIGSEHITILDAYTLDEQSFQVDEQTAYSILDPENEGDIILVPDSRQSICRLLDIPDVPQAQLEQVVSLRLEVELPYPPDQSTWSFARQGIDAEGNAPVLLLAAAKPPITLAEDYLKTKGIQCNGLEVAQGSLAELAALSESTTDTVAIAKIDDQQVLLTISHKGTLSYTRHARLEFAPMHGNGSSEKWFDSLAQDLRQSMMDFSMRRGHEAPATLIVTGNALTEDSHCEALNSRLHIPVELLPYPDIVRHEKPALMGDELLQDYSIGLGVLVALYHRQKGEASIAPALRQKTTISSLNLTRITKKLLTVNALLLLALFISIYAVQRVRLNTTERFIDESKPLVATMDKLEEEVDILKYEEGQRRPVLDVLMALNEILPKELKVESFNIDRKGKLVITGTTKSVEAVSDNVYEAIKDSPLFKNPVFGGATSGKKGFGFTLSCELSAGMQGAGK